MVIEELQTDLVATRVSSPEAEEAELVDRVAPAEPVVRVGLAEQAELAVRVVQVAQEALAGLAVQVEQVVRVAPVGLAVQAEPAVQAGQVELVVQVAPVELGIAPEVPAQETVPAEVVPELVPAEVVPERDPVVLPLRTKSATDLHHRDRVVARRVEDSAVAAETTREPAVTEAEKAWAAAE
jgi:hypothetical protein